MDDAIKKARRRHKAKVRKQTRKDRKPRCEVIQCGAKGPHRCTARGWPNGDGRVVCTHHQIEAPHVAVFTAEEAIALYRKRLLEGKGWLPMWLTGRSE